MIRERSCSQLNLTSCFLALALRSAAAGQAAGALCVVYEERQCSGRLGHCYDIFEPAHLHGQAHPATTHARTCLALSQPEDAGRQAAHKVLGLGGAWGEAAQVGHLPALDQVLHDFAVVDGGVHCRAGRRWRREGAVRWQKISTVAEGQDKHRE